MQSPECGAADSASGPDRTDPNGHVFVNHFVPDEDQPAVVKSDRDESHDDEGRQWKHRRVVAAEDADGEERQRHLQLNGASNSDSDAGPQPARGAFTVLGVPFQVPDHVYRCHWCPPIHERAQARQPQTSV